MVSYCPSKNSEFLIEGHVWIAPHLLESFKRKMALSSCCCICGEEYERQLSTVFFTVWAMLDGCGSLLKWDIPQPLTPILQLIYGGWRSQIILRSRGRAPILCFMSPSPYLRYGRLAEILFSGQPLFTQIMSTNAPLTPYKNICIA